MFGICLEKHTVLYTLMSFMIGIASKNSFIQLMFIECLLCVLDLHALAHLSKAYFSSKTTEIIYQRMHITLSV